AFIKPTCYKS
ncbi:hypothetical protein D030_5315B, partial [Vibrio parahaemolyticus AQ3810]